MNEAEEFLQALEQSLAVVGDDGIGGLSQEAHFSDQMRQTKLHHHRCILHVGSVGGIVIMAQHGFAVLTQRPFKHFSPARGFDGKDGEGRSPEDPVPQGFSVFGMSCLVDVEHLLVGQGGPQLGVGGL